jgi:hypothetical protein
MRTTVAFESVRYKLCHRADGVLSNCERSAAVPKTSRSMPLYSKVFRVVQALRLVLRTQPRSKNEF